MRAANYVLDIVAVIIYGLSLKILWTWFIVPLFHLPVLTIPHAIGLILVAYAVRPEWNTPVPEEWEDFFWFRIQHLITGPVLTLVTGWIVHWFI